MCYAKSEREQKDYIAYIDEQYNSERLTKILCDVTEKIGATVLNISKQDYDPQGASVNVLFAEGYIDPDHVDESCNKGAGYFNRSGIQPNTVHAHLDKVISRCTLSRNITRIRLFLPSAWISTSPPAARSPR